MKMAPINMPFYGKDAKPALSITMIMGLQHMLAMLVGVITPPRLLANEGCLLGRDPELCALTPYLICSALLASGLLSILQIMRVRLCGGYYFGTGLVSVVGPSFTFLPIGQTMMKEATLFTPVGACSGETVTGVEMYGKFLGTCAIAALIEIALSFIPPKLLKKICPPVVTGTVVFLIGGALTVTGVKYWGGGVFCADNTWSRAMESAVNGNKFIRGPQSCWADNGGERQNPPTGEIIPGFAPPGMQGYDAPYGDPVFVGYGALAILIFVLIATFGSPFMRSCNIAISFLLTYAIASGFEGEEEVESWGVMHKEKLVTGMFGKLTSKENPISFLWNGIIDAKGSACAVLPAAFGRISDADR